MDSVGRGETQPRFPDGPQVIIPSEPPESLSMRHERRSSPLVLPAIILFCALASWIFHLPIGSPKATTSASLTSGTE